MQNNMQTQQGTTGQQQTALTDQELAFDLLYQEKALLSNIALNDMFMQIGQDQLQIFQVMNRNNWYQLKPAQEQDIQTAKQKYQQMRQTL